MSCTRRFFPLIVLPARLGARCPPWYLQCAGMPSMPQPHSVRPISGYIAEPSRRRLASGCLVTNTVVLSCRHYSLLGSYTPIMSLRKHSLMIRPQIALLSKEN